MLKVVHRSQKILPVLVAALFFSVPLALLMGGGLATAETVDYNVYVRPSLKISFSDNPVVINLNPNSHPFGTADVDITVGTNNVYGYKLFMNTDSDETRLTRDSLADSIVDHIPTLASSTTTSAFPANYWGYRINNDVGGDSGVIDTTATNYYAYTPGVVISSSTTATNERTANLTFASKIDYGKSSGKYELTFNLKALPNISTNYIQNLNPNLCTEEPLTVIDSRDEQPYTVQRLADGNCWMMTNLNLTHITEDLTAADTNIAEGATVSADTFNGWKKSVSSDTYTDAEFIPLSGTDAASKMPYGTLYNYCAITAGTYCYDDNSGVGNASHDLCPAGWRLPTGGPSGEYKNLYDQPAYNSNALMRAPILDGGAAFALAGFTHHTSVSPAPEEQGSSGRYWTSTIYLRNQMYRAVLNLTGVYPTNSDYRDSAVSVRCIRDTRTIADINNMQEINGAIVKNTSEGSTGNLVDVRETKTYSVKKLNNNLWMTKNLSLGCTNNATNPVPTSRTLTNTDTNITTTSYSTTTTTLDTGGSSYDNAYIACNATYGAYYNYAAATAGTITGNSNTDEAFQDVCPNGWKLPSQAEITTIKSEVAKFVIVNDAGYYNGSTLTKLDNRSFWWTSTLSSSGNISRIKLSTDANSPSTGEFNISGFGRTNGINIRCIAR